MSTTHFNTKERILGAAEELFAQHGFAGTSLRQVTSRADVNIAAVNYPFASKETLVNEVFRRRMDEMRARPRRPFLSPHFRSRSSPCRNSASARWPCSVPA